MNKKKAYTSPVAEIMEFTFELAWGKKCVVYGSDVCGSRDEDKFK